MQIQMIYEDVMIKNIKVDDYVMSYNIKNNKIEPKKVSKTFTPIVKKSDQLRILLSDGGQIINSKKHPLLVKRNNKWVYVKASDCFVGDLMMNDKLEIVYISDIQKNPNYNENDFRDLEVQDNNNFFAGIGGFYCTHNSSNNNNVWYHYEIELIAQLKDTRGTAETRTRHTDQTIILNNYFLKKALNKEDVYLFHPNQVPGLYEVLGNEEEFAKLYEKYSEEIPKKDKKKVNAYQLLDLILFERSFTGRIYLVFADNIYKSSWKNPVYNVNLCVEVVVPSTPLDGSLGTPEIGSCILGAINHGYVKDDDIEAICDYLVNFLDYMIDYSDYSIPEVEYSAKKRRTLGIGHSDIFHYLAKNKKFYNTSEGRELIHNRIEKCYYYLLKASNELAKTRGKCELYDDTKYSQGYLTFDEYKDHKETNFKLLMDWKSLRESIKEFGLRNSTLSSTMPCGNSANVSGSTSGIEPPRELSSIKGDKNTKIMKLVPEYARFKNYYTTAWGDDFNNIDYFKFIGIIQKFTDQSISTNQYTNVLKYKDNIVPLSEIIKEILTANKYGLKTLYYQNFLSIENKDGISDEKQEGCGSGGCVV